MATVDPTPTPDPTGPSGPTGPVPVTQVPWYRSPAFIAAAAAAVVALIVIFIVLAANGDDDDEPDHPMVTPSPTLSVSPSPSVSVSPSPTPSPDNAVTRATVLKTQFVEPLRVRFPKLAEDRSDNDLADVGVTACNTLSIKGVTRSGVLKAVGLSVDKDAVKASEDNIREITKIAVMNTCPDRQKAFVRVFGTD